MNFFEGQKEPADIIYTSGFIVYCFIFNQLNFDRFVTIYDHSLIFFLIFFYVVTFDDLIWVKQSPAKKDSISRLHHNSMTKNPWMFLP